MLFFWTFYSLKKSRQNVSLFPQAAQLFLTLKCLFGTKSVISEGSCDSEDWSSDAENTTLPSQV